MKIIKSEKIPIKLWLDKIEPDALRQAKNIANLEGAFHHIAIMPDAHVGYGMPIGGVLATRNIIIPNAVGVDIGCGMVAVKTSAKKIDEAKLKKILEKLRQTIPTGFNHHKKPQEWEGFERAPNVPIIQQELKSARRQIGTLGGGNHFVEVLEETDDKKHDLKSNNNIWLMLHSGSRNFGLKVASVYHKKAQRFCQDKNINLPDRDLAFLPLGSKEGQEYFKAMKYCLEFAAANRQLMMKRFMAIFQEITGCNFVNFNEEYGRENLISAILPHPAPPLRKGRELGGGGKEISVCIHHNYASEEEHFGQKAIVHRKGATSAFVGQLGIVPGSMGTPSFIVEGLGNPESFMSSAHGAGRQMGRKEANRKLTEKEAQAAIKGVMFGRWHGKFDEAPQAYKDIEEVIDKQIDLARPVVRLKPLMVMIGN